MSDYKTQMALIAIGEAIADQSNRLTDHDSRLGNLERLVKTQAQDVATLQQRVVELRDSNIRLAIDNGMPTKVVAELHGITSSRVSQLAPRRLRS